MTYSNNQSELEKRISEFRKDTKYVYLTIESKSPIPLDKISDFVLMTDCNLSTSAFSNYPENIFLIQDLCGFFDIGNQILEKCSPSAFDVNNEFTQVTEMNYILNSLRGNFRLSTLYFSHLCSSNRTVINANTGDLLGTIPTGKYPTSSRLASDFIALSTLDYLDVVVRIWDGKEEPASCSEYCDDPIINDLSFHIKNGDIVEVTPDSKEINTKKITDIYPDTVILRDLGMPLDNLKSICTEIKQKLDAIINVDIHAEFLEMANGNKGYHNE